jgi:hypothetical protein
MVRLRPHAARLAAIVVVAVAAWLARAPAYSASDRSALAARFSFERLALPTASDARMKSVRVFEPQLRRIEGWMSSVGAAVALTDADGDGRPNDTCLVDPRTDSVTVAPAPGSGARYRPFLLDPRPLLRYDPRTMAPMGCLPGDFDEDGTTDFLVYYWGRTPALFLGRERGRPSAAAFEHRELSPSVERWFTDTITTADVDGDGHTDIVVGNYFPDGARLLDARATDDPLMQMQDSMSRAYNGGTNRIYLWTAPGRYREAVGALSSRVARGWTLAAAAADLNGDLRPELYFANDFGPDRLLVNESTPGRVRLREVSGRRTFTAPASKVLGHDSFKGMGADFADMNRDGRLDLMVSNITSEFALQESNFAFINTGRRLAPGSPAPFEDRSEPLGLARSGWAWDVKLGDFDNDGDPEIVQTKGFLKGKTDRWPQLHELALSNDEVLRMPHSWPRFARGDDLSGDEPASFFVRGPRERYVDLADAVGLARTRSVTRGVATADIDRDGRLDLAVASQWGQSYLYRNRAPRPGGFLGLDLRIATSPKSGTTRLVRRAPRGARTRPAIGATATVRLPDGRTLVGQVDGGNGHASVRAPELFFGLGPRAPRRLIVTLAWRAPGGGLRRATLRLAPGWHTVLFDEGSSS